LLRLGVICKPRDGDEDYNKKKVVKPEGEKTTRDTKA